jgi:hypothetical protein
VRTPEARRWTLLVALAAAALPIAGAAAVPVALYPVQAEGLTDGERSEVQAVVESALLAADRRGVLEPRTPLLLPGSCKAPITVGCVAMQAKGGVVLYAKAKRRGAQILVTVLFVDGTGRKTRAAAFPVDLFIQNLRPANDAIATVEAELAAGALEDPTPPPAPVRPPAERPKAAERTPAVSPPPAPVVIAPVPEPAAPPPEPSPSEAVASTPIDLTPLPKAEPARTARLPQRTPEREADAAKSPGDWKRSAGRWCIGSGAAMLVAGAVVGITGKRLSDTLSDRYAMGALRPGDGRLYDRVDRYALVANGLLAVGGVTTATGLGLLVFAPSGNGASVAVAGSF